MGIGERIRKLSAESGLSPEELEDTAGLETGYLSRVIEGEEVSTCDILGRLATALEVPLARLFFQEGEAVVTSKLAPRLTIEQLAEDQIQRQPVGILDGVAAAWRFGRRVTRSSATRWTRRQPRPHGLS